MRFKIDFRLLGEPPFAVPVTYQSEISTWIHKMLHFQSKAFTSWLEEKKFIDPETKQYKLFTFSDVFFSSHKFQDEKMVVNDDKAEMVLSFYAPEEIESFIMEIFNGQEFKIGDSRGKLAFKIEEIHCLDAPDFKKGKGAVFTCLSPMLVAEPGKNPPLYADPDDKTFEKVFFKSLMFKYANLVKFMSANPGDGLSSLNELKFTLLGKPKAKHIKITSDTPHQKAMKGYMFDFEVKAPVELLNIGYNAGFGEMNHLGFGCCKLKKH